MCEKEIEKLEEDMAVKNGSLESASRAGDNNAIMGLSREIGLIQQAIDALFERLEIATEADEAILAEYEMELKEING